ncbi:hypothetical protein BB341_13185 [Streptomyces clavuligerus]|uniref:Uncharacterized protein n=1 Tax=Streptomyces clavuligerus TaxID=1901 RepID=B5GT69_STRCL|nr:hypothetical protein BB341_13185 [Streptomyces clavuligerus]AXU13686.1 hypothetical protein D1794_13665 [Streptomyces clavuligerus]EDY49515.1 hypothetical protein SSCG_02543 [Streptomyces clavuligerus]EFG08157.1 Hypothetical protein SCLAV_3086 [Streptomyces clavuligerus]QCS06472.1 hypothetical protein CRV15_13100 [Streptomyces clavuligerus]
MVLHGQVRIFPVDDQGTGVAIDDCIETKILLDDHHEASRQHTGLTSPSRLLEPTSGEVDRHFIARRSK